jgi:hypothetical protein
VGVTHTNIYNLQANQFLAQSANPTNRENAEYLTPTQTGLDDGDAFYDTDNDVFKIHVGAKWMLIGFGS